MTMTQISVSFRKYSLGRLILALYLLPSCVATNNKVADHKQMDGYLIKEHLATDMSARQKLWFSDVRSRDPSMASMLETIGKQDWVAGIEQAKRILKKDPFNSLCFLVLATAYARQDDWEKARFYAKKILQSSPGHVAASNIMGLYKTKEAKTLADYRAAIRWFLKSFKGSSGELASGLNLGYLYLSLGDHHGAAAVFKEVYARCQQCSAGALGMGIALRRAGRVGEARRLFGQVVEAHPNAPTAWYQLALIFRTEDKNYSKSSQYLKKILENQSIRDGELLEKARIVWADNRNSGR